MNDVIITLVSKVGEENSSSESLKIWKVNSHYEHYMSVNFIEKETFAANEMFILYINFYVFDELYLLGKTFLTSRSDWWNCHILDSFKVEW
jgi:hypothetical protein